MDSTSVPAAASASVVVPLVEPKVELAVETSSPKPATTRKRKRKHKRWRSFEECRSYAQTLGLTSQKMWKAWRKGGRVDSDGDWIPDRPEDVPGSPDEAYKGKGWKSWGDFLGTGNNQNNQKVYRSFEACRDFARSLGLRTWKDWMKWSKESGQRPLDVPSHPDRTYKGQGWDGYKDFLGKKAKPAGKTKRRRKSKAKKVLKGEGVKQEDVVLGVLIRRSAPVGQVTVVEAGTGLGQKAEVEQAAEGGSRGMAGSENGDEVEVVDLNDNTKHAQMREHAEAAIATAEV